METLSFTKDDFISGLKKRHRIKGQRRFGEILREAFIGDPTEIDLGLAQSLSDMIISRAESKGVVRLDSHKQGNRI